MNTDTGMLKMTEGKTLPVNPLDWLFLLVKNPVNALSR
jgi:hypothetical protein